MTSDDIIRMAREAGATPYTNRHYPDRPAHTFNPEQLQRFAAKVEQAVNARRDDLLAACHQAEPVLADLERLLQSRAPGFTGLAALQAVRHAIRARWQA